MGDVKDYAKLDSSGDGWDDGDGARKDEELGNGAVSTGVQVYRCIRSGGERENVDLFKSFEKVGAKVGAGWSGDRCDAVGAVGVTRQVSVEKKEHQTEDERLERLTTLK